MVHLISGMLFTLGWNEAPKSASTKDQGHRKPPAFSVPKAQWRRTVTLFASSHRRAKMKALLITLTVSPSNLAPSRPGQPTRAVAAT